MSEHPPVSLVTGGSRGLGRNTAIKLAEQGSDVLLTYRSGRSDAESAVKEIERRGRRARALALDVANVASFDAFAGEVRGALSQWGRERFDHLVNNAGVGIHATVAEVSEAQFDELMSVHLKGVVFLTQKLLPLIADGGRIVNVSTGLTRITLPGYGIYAAMKGAVEVLTRYMAKELGARRIAVNVVAPGAIATDFGGGLVRDNERVNAMIASNTALGRVGLPDDIGGVIASLLSPANAWINAQRIEASGGQML
jgi:NAD(P)-dependent dehydrogenase (short-subunit alcohol dehydrogenase family)